MFLDPSVVSWSFLGLTGTESVGVKGQDWMKWIPRWHNCHHKASADGAKPQPWCFLRMFWPLTLAHASGTTEYGNNLKTSESSWRSSDHRTPLSPVTHTCHQGKVCIGPGGVVTQILYSPFKSMLWVARFQNFLPQTFSQSPGGLLC